MIYKNPNILGFLGGGSDLTPDKMRSKSNKVRKRRAKNKMARRSRRINSLRARGLNLK